MKSRDENIEITWKEVDSSMIQDIVYMESNGIGTLAVKFRAGSFYLYRDVTRQAVSSLLTADSVGKAFSDNIKEKFKYSKVM